MGVKEVLPILQKNKAVREAAKKFAQAATQAAAGSQSPVVKLIQAGYGLYSVGNSISRGSNVEENLNALLPKVGDVAGAVMEFIPSMQVMGKCVCDSAKVFTSFSSMATVVGISANIIVTYQGVQALELIGARLQDISTHLAAQNALRAQRDFPGYVYKMIQQRLGETMDDAACDHWFFLYHPDNDWYPEFYHLLEKNPVGPRFCGYTNQIDTAFVFMLATRRRQVEKERRAQEAGKSVRPVRIHLLIPAYQPILIAEPLRIPREMGDFVMEGRINSNKEFVWFNLPQEQRHHVLDIGLWVPPPQGWCDWALSSMGLKVPPRLMPRRVLGQRQKLRLGKGGEIEQVQGIDGDEGPSSAVDISPAGVERRSRATALDRRPRKQRRRAQSEQPKAK
jgi:hypothetical protein